MTSSDYDSELPRGSRVLRAHSVSLQGPWSRSHKPAKKTTMNCVNSFIWTSPGLWTNVQDHREPYPSVIPEKFLSAASPSDAFKDDALAARDWGAGKATSREPVTAYGRYMPGRLRIPTTHASHPISISACFLHDQTYRSPP